MPTPRNQLFFFVETAHSTRPELFVADTEEEMLAKLKARFRKYRKDDFKAKNFGELEAELEAMGRGYQGSVDLYFTKVEAN